MKLVIIIELEQYVEGPKVTDDNVLSKSQAMRSESNWYCGNFCCSISGTNSTYTSCEISERIDGLENHVERDLNERDMVIVNSRVFDVQLRYLKLSQLDKIFYFFPLAGEATMFCIQLFPAFLDWWCLIFFIYLALF